MASAGLPAEDTASTPSRRQACSQPGQGAARRPGLPGRGSEERVRGNEDRGVTRVVPGLLADQGEETGFYSDRERKSSMGFKPTNDKLMAVGRKHSGGRGAEEATQPLRRLLELAS